MSDLPEIRNGAKDEMISYDSEPLSHFQRQVGFIDCFQFRKRLVNSDNLHNRLTFDLGKKNRIFYYS